MGIWETSENGPTQLMDARFKDEPGTAHAAGEGELSAAVSTAVHTYIVSVKNENGSWYVLLTIFPPSQLL